MVQCECRASAERRVQCAECRIPQREERRTSGFSAVSLGPALPHFPLSLSFSLRSLISILSSFVPPFFLHSSIIKHHQSPTPGRSLVKRFISTLRTKGQILVLGCAAESRDRYCTNHRPSSWRFRHLRSERASFLPARA